MKVVVNGCHGGFGLSPEATLRLWREGTPGVDATHVDEYWPPEEREQYARRSNAICYETKLRQWREYLASGTSELWFLDVFTPDEQYVLNARDVPRDHPNLIRVVEEMGAAANGACAKLEIREIPDDVQWEIKDYDGSEWVAEKHRTW